MLETTDRSEHQEDLCLSHADAFSNWLATKTIENDSRKALLLRSNDVVCGSTTAILNDSPRRTIVVVYDEPHIAITLSEILERRDYRAVWFTEPVAALAHMRIQRPDLLLTDVNMPMLDGFDLALGLWRTHPHCPVLIVSAIGDDPQLAQRVVAAGVSIALEAKPVQICKLLSRITELLSGQPGCSFGALDP